MARRAILLEDLSPEDPGTGNYMVAFWLEPVVSQRSFYARLQGGADATSQVPDVSAGELAQLRAGELYELVMPITIPSANPNRATVENEIAARYNELQAALVSSKGVTRFRWTLTHYDPALSVGQRWVRTTNN